MSRLAAALRTVGLGLVAAGLVGACASGPGLPQPHGVTFSMGSAERHPGIDGIDALIAEADRHLYRAKAQGRDTLCAATIGALPVAEQIPG